MGNSNPSMRTLKKRFRHNPDFLSIFFLPFLKAFLHKHRIIFFSVGIFPRFVQKDHSFHREDVCLWETVKQLVISKAWVISEPSFPLWFSVAEKIKTQAMGSAPELQQQFQFFPQPALCRPRILQSIPGSGLVHLSFAPFSIFLPARVPGWAWCPSSAP